MERYDSLANLKDCLAQTGMYTLDGTTLVDVELICLCCRIGVGFGCL